MIAVSCDFPGCQSVETTQAGLHSLPDGWEVVQIFLRRGERAELILCRECAEKLRTRLGTKVDPSSSSAEQLVDLLRIIIEEAIEDRKEDSR